MNDGDWRVLQFCCMQSREIPYDVNGKKKRTLDFLDFDAFFVVVLLLFSMFCLVQF